MKKLICLVVLLAGCATGPTRWESELKAYENYLNAEIAAGRMTLPQGQYLYAAKRNEIEGRRSAEQDRAMGNAALGAAIMNSSGPIFVPRGPQY